MNNLVLFIESLLDSINKYSNLLLVAITTVYVVFTGRMISAMKYQFTSDIKLGNKNLGSSLRGEWFEGIITNSPEQLKGNSIDFKLCFDVFNRKPGSGSISKPVLVINFPDGYKKILKPKTKERKSRKIDDNVSEIWEEDLGNTIYLKGGDFLNIELEYVFIPTEERDIEHLKKDYRDVGYYIEYSDNTLKKHQIKVTSVKSYHDVGRK